jgi:adenylate cyclase
MTTKDVKRKLRAILSADVQGYSRLMGDDEVATVKTITEYRETLTSLVNQYNGRVVDSPGDNVLAEFGSVVDAVQCAVEIQHILKAKNEELPENRRMIFRIGVNLGDVIQDGDRIYGDGVNIAARIESLADGGGICISGTAYDQIENKLALGYNFIGEHSVKNIAKPVRVYKVPMDPKDVGKKRTAKPWKKAAIAAAVLILGAGAIAIWHFYFRPPPVEVVTEAEMAFPLPDKPSIAVLPFTNIGDPEQQYIADGITEQIITALARDPYLFVIASNSTSTYKGKPVKVQQVSRELGVRYVVEGSVQRSDDKIRITAQLIDALRGEHMWAENYDRDLKDLFTLQDEITLKILKATRGKLLGWDELSREKGTTNIEAYLKLLKARTLSGTNKPNNRLAMQMCEESVALDPEFAEAYSLLAMTHFNDANNGWSQSPAEDRKKAVELARKAISLDQSVLLPHNVLGQIYLAAGKHNEAVAEGEKAVALVPSSSLANAWLCHFLAWADRSEEAILVAKNVLRLNPFPGDWELCWVANAYLVAGRYEEALEYYKKAQDRNPDNFWPYCMQAGIYGLLGREEEARAAAKELLRLHPRFLVEYWAKWPGCKNRDKWNLFIDGLRKAGLK